MPDGVIGVVANLILGLVHAHKFEEEVGEGSEIEALAGFIMRLIRAKEEGSWWRGLCRTYDGDDHAGFVFPAGEQGSHDEDDNCDRNGGDSEVEFDFFPIDDDDEELDSKAKEKEKVELQEGNVDLESSQKMSFSSFEDEHTWKVKYLLFIRRSALICLYIVQANSSYSFHATTDIHTVPTAMMHGIAIRYGRIVVQM